MVVFRLPIHVNRHPALIERRNQYPKKEEALLHIRRVRRRMRRNGAGHVLRMSCRPAAPRIAEKASAPRIGSSAQLAALQVFGALITPPLLCFYYVNYICDCGYVKIIMKDDDNSRDNSNGASLRLLMCRMNKQPAMLYYARRALIW